MDRENFVGLINDKFKNDPLLEQIKISGLDNHLFPDRLIEQLNTNNTYSLSQAAEILEVKDHNLRNYLNRHYLDEYIQTERLGKLYRLDYKSIFKFHMIFILVNYGKRTPTDIASYVGTKAEVGNTTIRSNRERAVNDSNNISNELSNSNEFEKRLENIEKSILMMNWERMVEQAKNNLEISIRQVKDWENKVTLIGREIENLELRKLIEKQEKRTSELIKDSHKRIGLINNKQATFSFKNLFMKPKIEEVDYDKVLSEAETNADKSVATYSYGKIDDKINALRSEINELQDQKQELIENKNQMESRYKELQSELHKFKNTLESDDTSKKEGINSIEYVLSND